MWNRYAAVCIWKDIWQDMKRMALRALLMSAVVFFGIFQTISDFLHLPRPRSYPRYSIKSMANIKERFEIDVDLEAFGWNLWPTILQLTKALKLPSKSKFATRFLIQNNTTTKITVHSAIWLSLPNTLPLARRRGMTAGYRVRSGPSRFRCRIAEYTSCDTWSCHGLVAILGFGTLRLYLITVP